MDDDKLFDDSEDGPRIKVTDRRKFAADGTPRSSGAADAADDGSTGDGPADELTDGNDAPHLEPDAPAPGNQENAAGSDTPPPAGPDVDEQRRAAQEADIADLPRDFAAFVEGMYLEAMLYLGALPDPRSGQVMEDFELARYKIDLLSMIEEKTQGNLSDDEKQQLDEVLYQLRTVYLQATKTADS